MQVGAVALEEFVGSQRQEDVEVARRPAAKTRLALARQRNASPVFHALRNIDRKTSLARHPPRAGAGGTGLFDHLSAALAGGTGSLQGEEALRVPNSSRATTHAAGLRLGAGLRADPGTGLAGHRHRNLDLRRLALKSFFERDFHIVAQIGAALAAAARPLSGHAEQVLENIGEGGGESGAKTGGAATAMLEGGMAEAVIGSALFAVFQDFVGFVDFFESEFAGGISRILVRMPFHRELAKGRLEFRFVCVSVDFKGFVITALGGHPSNPPEFRTGVPVLTFVRRCGEFVYECQNQRDTS